MTERRTAIVTGGAQGIGKAIAQELLQQGKRVVIADVDPEAGEQAVHELRSLGDLDFAQTDVAKEDDVQALVGVTVERYRSLDILVNNAGIMISKKLEELTWQEWRRVIDTNLSGTFLCSKYAAPHLRSSKGTIVNIASTRAFMSEPDTEAYAASKGGIVALTHALALSLAPHVRVNCISPGWIDVSGWKRGGEQAVLTEADHLQHPAGRVGRPEDVAAMVAYLVSAEAAFVTAANFVIDGGMTRKMIYA